jgi:hypothetical protein
VAASRGFTALRCESHDLATAKGLPVPERAGEGIGEQLHAGLHHVRRDHPVLEAKGGRRPVPDKVAGGVLSATGRRSRPDCHREDVHRVDAVADTRAHGRQRD